MKYTSTNQLEQFSFQDAVIAEVRLQHTTFTLDLDNITILSNNTHNRDIHDMRANNAILTFTEATINKIVAEGYRVYDANNELTESVDDQVIDPKDFSSFFPQLANTTIYSIEQTDNKHCVINIDAEYQTYLIEVSYDTSLVEWDRFLTKE